MADSQTEPREGVIKEAGSPVRASFPGQKKIDEALGAGDNVATETDQQIDVADKVKTTSTQQTPPEINDDAIKEYLKKQGIEYNGVEDLKKKLTPVEKEAELTDEQKNKVKADKEKRLLDIHIARGGTPEQFVNFQKQASAEPGDLGKLKLSADLKAAGFPEDKISGIVKKMHLDISDEELDGMDDDEKAEIIKERDFGLSKLNNRGTIYKKLALDYIGDLERQMADEDTDKTQKKQHASNVEAAFVNYQRKQSLDLGMANDVQIPPVEVEIPETVLTEVKDTIKDKAKWESQIYNKDGTVNLDYLLPHLIKSHAYTSAAKTTYLEGETRGTAKALKNFSPKPTSLGGNNAAGAGEKGKLATAGAPVKGNPFSKK